jgi:hypothetical protein
MTVTISEEDLNAVSAQLGRIPRGVRSIAYRCPCGKPAVIENAPRLPDGEPFPTLFYATCPKLNSAIGQLEGSGLMRSLEEKLSADPVLAEQYEQAHQDYLSRRNSIEVLPERIDFSAGGMPERVKCLHALIAHSLAVGPGVNPVGDLAIQQLPNWWESGVCNSE